MSYDDIRAQLNQYPMRCSDNADNIDNLRTIWAMGQNLGKIVIIEGKEIGDPEDTACAIIISTRKELIRIPLTKDGAMNTGRALISAVT